MPRFFQPQPPPLEPADWVDSANHRLKQFSVGLLAISFVLMAIPDPVCTSIGYELFKYALFCVSVLYGVDAIIVACSEAPITQPRL